MEKTCSGDFRIQRRGGWAGPEDGEPRKELVYDDVYRAPSYLAWLDASGFDEGWHGLRNTGS